MSPPDGENHTFGFSANHTIGSVTPSDEMIGEEAAAEIILAHTPPGQAPVD